MGTYKSGHAGLFKRPIEYLSDKAKLFNAARCIDTKSVKRHSEAEQYIAMYYRYMNELRVNYNHKCQSDCTFWV